MLIIVSLIVLHLLVSYVLLISQVIEVPFSPSPKPYPCFGQTYRYKINSTYTNGYRYFSCSMEIPLIRFDSYYRDEMNNFCQSGTIEEYKSFPEEVCVNSVNCYTMKCVLRPSIWNKKTTEIFWVDLIPNSKNKSSFRQTQTLYGTPFIRQTLNFFSDILSFFYNPEPYEMGE